MTASKRQQITPVGQSLSARLAKLEATSIQQANVINLLTMRLRDVYQWAQSQGAPTEPDRAPLIITRDSIVAMDESGRAELASRGFPKDLLDAELTAGGG